MDLVPMLLDVVPRLRPGPTLLEQDGEDPPAVLIANLAGGSVVERTGDEFGIKEASQRLECVGLETGIAGVFAGSENLIVERGVAIAGGDHNSCIAECGVEVLILFAA